MSVGTKDRTRTAVFNVPNQLTSLRLALAVVMFCLIPFQHYMSSMVLFLVAAGTDWLDGYYARKYGQVTTLGRILDPFVDKIIICGTFIFLAAAPASGIAAWMAVVIVGRELLVTALRSFLEQQGSDFSASLSGKVKMVLQCAACGLSLFSLTYVAGGASMPDWLEPSRNIAIWSSVAATVYSGIGYIQTAVKLLRQP